MLNDFKIHSRKKSNEMNDTQCVKFLSWLELNFNHLNKHKLRQNFKDCVGPMCGCGLEIKSAPHFFLGCHFYHVESKSLIVSITCVMYVCIYACIDIHIYVYGSLCIYMYIYIHTYRQIYYIYIYLYIYMYIYIYIYIYIYAILLLLYVFSMFFL